MNDTLEMNELNIACCIHCACVYIHWHLTPAAINEAKRTMVVHKVDPLDRADRPVGDRRGSHVGTSRHTTLLDHTGELFRFVRWDSYRFPCRVTRRSCHTQEHVAITG
ncbi:hypothetical protein LSAT2_017012 [Lamellibrachia satsuma]|nr:hypothetical protein LSAT2_017012 [Lamellibrachia satsuma]